MPRYFLELAYDGKSFHGYQVQPDRYTVQQAVEEALATALRQAVRTQASGRTDTGVHAEQQFVHFNLNTPLTDSRLVQRLNGLLPDSVRVHALYSPRPQKLHARFHALSRRYRYRLSYRPLPLERHLRVHMLGDIRLEAMQQASAFLPQYIDFASFCKAHGGNHTTLCQILDVQWRERPEEGTLDFEIEANRFLRGMVRGIVGLLLEIGRGKYPPEHMAQVLDARNRQAAGPQAPPQGLSLYRVRYPAGSLFPLQWMGHPPTFP